MKTTKLVLTSLILLAVLTVSATHLTNSTNPDSTVVLQCGVSNAQISEYLRNCSHHHSVYSVWDIPGTCNSRASIEGCGTATVYVEAGILIGHTDSYGSCD